MARWRSLAPAATPVFAAAALTLLVAGGCGIRPLTSVDLYGAPGVGGQGATGGGAGSAGSAGTAAAGTGGDGSTAGAAGSGGLVPDAAVDQIATDVAPADGGPDTPPSACAQPCTPDQFCDELTNQCAPRAGTGMLSGSVIDPCSGNGIAARVGIAGQRQCSAPFKGAFFFQGLPLGRLKVTVAKDGYELYGATVEVVTGGVVGDIQLVRVGGCAAPIPAATCTCTEPTCNPRTP